MAEREDIFLVDFVNRMYAILIGLGITKVLFDDEMKNFDILSISSGLFIVVVITIYWWDWNDYISDNIVNSKSEFVIDFSILIILELLFVYHNDIRKISFVLVLVSLFDLLWVVEHVRRRGHSFYDDKEKIRKRKVRSWVVKRIFGIFVYLSFAGLLICGPTSPTYTALLSVVIAFALVRGLLYPNASEIEAAKPAASESL